jgi:peptidoglycan-associated lipoprotein
MSFDTQRAARLALIGLAAASLAACASRPKPRARGADAEPPPPRRRPLPAAAGSAGRQGPLPGSVQDFVVNVGDRVYFDTDSYSVRADAQPVLAAQAQWLNRYPAGPRPHRRQRRRTRHPRIQPGPGRAPRGIRAQLSGQRGVPAGPTPSSRTIEDSWARNRNGHTAIVSGGM